MRGVEILVAFALTLLAGHSAAVRPEPAAPPQAQVSEVSYGYSGSEWRHEQPGCDKMSVQS